MGMDLDLTGARERRMMRAAGASLLAGGIGPLLIANFLQVEYRADIAGGVFSAAAILTLALIAVLRNIVPAEVVTQVENSLTAGCLVMSSGAFIAVGLAVLVAALPVPMWLHVIIALVLALIGLASLMRHQR